MGAVRRIRPSRPVREDKPHDVAPACVENYPTRLDRCPDRGWADRRHEAGDAMHADLADVGMGGACQEGLTGWVLNQGDHVEDDRVSVLPRGFQLGAGPRHSRGAIELHHYGPPRPSSSAALPARLRLDEMLAHVGGHGRRPRRRRHGVHAPGAPSRFRTIHMRSPDRPTSL